MNQINQINETNELREELRTLEILTTLFILFGDFPKKPFCIKYILEKYGIFKWVIVIIYLYNKKFPLKILITILLTYNIFYICDELYFEKHVKEKKKKYDSLINVNPT